MYKVIVAEKYDEERIIVEKRALQDLVDEAYQEGYRKGFNDRPITYPHITWTSTPTPFEYTTTSKETPYTYTTITCSTDDGIR